MTDYSLFSYFCFRLRLCAVLQVAFCQLQLTNMMMMMMMHIHGGTFDVLDQHCVNTVNAFVVTILRYRWIQTPYQR